MPSDLVAQGARIGQLERELQRVRIGGIGCLLFAVALALSGFGRGTEQVVQAERVELVSTRGVRQAILSADTLGFAVTLLDERGRPTGSLRLSNEPRLAVETGRGREVAGLGAPKAHNLRD